MAIYNTINKQQQLIILLFIILFINFFILYFGYFKERMFVSQEPLIEDVFVREERPRIDFSVFEKPLFRKLQEVDVLYFPSQEEIGKENPFLKIIK